MGFMNYINIVAERSLQSILEHFSFFQKEITFILNPMTSDFDLRITYGSVSLDYFFSSLHLFCPISW